MKHRIALAVFVLGASTWFGSPAAAACHEVTITATSPVTEGGNVSVKIERDGDQSASSFRVRTVNGTAKATVDFAEFDERVFFTGNQTSKSISIKTTENSTHESEESFKIEASEGQPGGGCGGDDFVYGSDNVTIKDDDPEPTPTRTPVPTTTTVVRTGTPTATPSPSGSPTPTPSTTPSSSPTESPFVAPSITPSIDEEDGGFPWLVLGLIVGLLAVAAGAVGLTRMRQSRAI